jgi:DNA-binding response OmpR family regulator
MLQSLDEARKEEARIAEEEQDYVMIVKEDPEESAQLKSSLERLGYKVKDVNNCSEALKAIKIKHPLLVISDIMLKGMKGHELCRAIKSEKETSSIPFMFISSSESTPDKTLGFQSYGDDYITTPFDLNVLKARVESLLQRTIGHGTDLKTEAKTGIAIEKAPKESEEATPVPEMAKEPHPETPTEIAGTIRPAQSALLKFFKRATMVEQATEKETAESDRQS